MALPKEFSAVAYADPNELRADLAARLTGVLLASHPTRLAHSEGVARRCRALGVALGFSKVELDTLVAAGWLHDVGYVMPETGFHPLDAALVLRQVGWESVACLVAWHSSAWEEAASLGFGEELEDFQAPQLNPSLQDVLTFADMTSAADGSVVGFESVLVAVRSGYGRDLYPCVEEAWPRLLCVRDRVAAAVSDAGVCLVDEDVRRV